MRSRKANENLIMALIKASRLLLGFRHCCRVVSTVVVVSEFLHNEEVLCFLPFYCSRFRLII